MEELITYMQMLVNNFLFRVDNMRLFDYVDVLLVTIAFYILIKVVRGSRVALLIRGVLIVGLLLVLTAVLLPLPTFDLIVWLGILSMAIITPIILQPELRNVLEQVGRSFGFSASIRKGVAERTIPSLVWAAENLSKSKTGALIVLEGDVDLHDIIETGIMVNGRITPELLQTIFFDKTPLHDGAVIVRGDQIAAASCILPLSDRSLNNINRRLGTRHRSAVGLSEYSDALVIVISEETGAISIAQAGKLRFNLDYSELRKALATFYTHPDSKSEPVRRNWRAYLAALNLPKLDISIRGVLREAGFFLLAFILALIAAMSLRAQADPLAIERVEGVQLLPRDMPEDTSLTKPLPEFVNIDAQTFQSLVSTLRPEDFIASVSLEGIGEEPQVVSVEARSRVSNVQAMNVIPGEVVVAVAPEINRTLPVMVKIEELDSLSAAYELAGPPQATPAEVIVSGPSTFVDKVISVEATVSVANATSTLNLKRPVAALDAQGNLIAEVTLQPNEVAVVVPVRRRIDAQDVGVRAVTTGSPPNGYWLSGLRVNPSSVTAQGNPAQIAELGSYVDTLPVDLSQITGESRIRMPLDLPGDIQAINSDGDIVNSVNIIVEVSARSGDLLTERSVEVVNNRGTFEIIIEPAVIELLLSGPLPTLNEIEAQPELVQVTIDASMLEPDSTIEIAPIVILPADVNAQLVQSVVLVTTGSIIEDQVVE